MQDLWDNRGYGSGQTYVGGSYQTHQFYTLLEYWKASDMKAFTQLLMQMSPDDVRMMSNAMQSIAKTTGSEIDLKQANMAVYMMDVRMELGAQAGENRNTMNTLWDALDKQYELYLIEQALNPGNTMNALWDALDRKYEAYLMEQALNFGNTMSALWNAQMPMQANFYVAAALPIANPTDARLPNGEKVEYGPLMIESIWSAFVKFREQNEDSARRSYIKMAESMAKTQGISPDDPEYASYIIDQVEMIENSLTLVIGLSGGIEYVSSIGNTPGLVRLAEEAGKNQNVQRDLNALTNKLIEGNGNPGRGTKNLFKDIYYLRADSGARVFYRNNDGVIEILAKASKANEDKVIKILTELYK